jgi:hypothetical protein
MDGAKKTNFNQVAATSSSTRSAPSWLSSAFGKIRACTSSRAGEVPAAMSRFGSFGADERNRCVFRAIRSSVTPD